MTERQQSNNLSIEVRKRSTFDSPHPDCPKEIIDLLKLAEREGAYGKLSEKRRKTLEMRFVEGLTMPQIGDVLQISKQAVSQTLKDAPESLYKLMVKDAISYRTHVSFREILATYSAYKVYLDGLKKGR
jgi:DNA-directed RNA polymerase specialized sigma subunit